jgi:glycerophosphoryl diester phosphodiesterase
MLKYIVIFFVTIVCFGYNAQAQSSKKSLARKVLVTAHRGDWRNECENSVKAFLSAAKMGVDIVELDLNMTKDSQIVIMHDATINRTTDGKGKPGDYTLTEIKKFRLKNGLGRPSAYTEIPTLKEVMIALKGKSVKVNLDKSFPYYNEAYNILKETGTLGQAIFKSEMPFDSLKQRYPNLIGKINYMAVVNLDNPESKAMIADYIKNMKVYGFELIFSKDTSSVLRQNDFIRNTGAKIWINSLWASLNGGHDDELAVDKGNTNDSWQWIINHHADIIQTDRPQKLLEYLRKCKLHQ